LIERFFNQIKQCRRIATRYDKLAANYLAFIKLVSIRIWLGANESTPQFNRRAPHSCLKSLVAGWCGDTHGFGAKNQPTALRSPANTVGWANA